MTGGDGHARGRSVDRVRVRLAARDDLVAVVRVLEGALLDVDAGVVRERIDADEALVAECVRPEKGVGGRNAGDDGPGAGVDEPDADDVRVVGALVRDGEHVVALAVRPRWRRRGIGTRLVERALAATGRLTAAFDPRVRGFYEALGFEVEPVANRTGRSERDGGDELDDGDGGNGSNRRTGRAGGSGRVDDRRLRGVRTG